MAVPFSQYDSRHYRTVDVATGYDAWAPTFDETADPDLDLRLLSRLEAVPWSSIQRAVDLGCGTGRTGAWLRGRGVGRVHGIDCVPAMLERAAAKRVYEQLCRADITRCPLPGRAYDLAITALAACHVRDLGALYAEAARLLQPGGFFVLLDYHPFFLLQGIPTHFDGAAGEPIAIQNQVHLFSDQVTAGRALDWSLLEMRERLVDQAWIARNAKLARHASQPVSFVMVWRAPA
jgi:SAM-dependent methyltransferase